MKQEWQRFGDKLFVSHSLERRWRIARSIPGGEPAPSMAELASEWGVDARALQWLMVELLEGSAEGGGAKGKPLDRAARRCDRGWSRSLRATVDLLVEAIDRGVQQLLDRVLHNPRLIALEAVWRAVGYLAEDVDPQSNVVLELLNVGRATFDAELDQKGALAGTAFGRLLLDSAHGPAEGPPAPYSLVIGLYEHGPTEPEISRLERMGELGRRAGWVFLSDASQRMFGLEDGTLAGLSRAMGERRAMVDRQLSRESLYDDEPFLRWATFRASEASRYVGLVVGRVRLRHVHRAALPGGAEYVERACGSLDASGLGPPWSSSTVLLAGVVVRAFLRDGIGINILGPKAGGAIARLPDRVPTPDGESDYLRHECVGSSGLEYELSQQGFITWADNWRRKPSFYSVPSCAAVLPGPNTREGKHRETNERLEAGLPYRMLLLRFVHYLAVIRRLNHGDVSDLAPLERALGSWLARYVSEDGGHPYRERPLQRAEVRLTRDSTGDGFEMQLTLGPRFRYMGATFTLTTGAWLPA